MKLEMERTSLRNFGQAMQFVIDATGKDGAEVLNRAGLHAIIGGKGVQGAFQRTPRASAAKIRSALSGVTARKIVLWKARQRGERLTRKDIDDRAKKLISRRASAAGYTRGPGWHKAAVALGGRGFRVQSRFEKSEARHGSGKKARPSDLMAEIVNTAPAAAKIGLIPLLAAIDDVARDMVEYGTKKLQSTFNKVNAK